MLNNFFFDNRAVYEIMLKYMVKPDRPEMTIWRMCIECLITKAYKHTLRIRNTYCFPTTAMFARTHINVTLCVHSLPCSLLCRTALQRAQTRQFLVKQKIRSVREKRINSVCIIRTLIYGQTVILKNLDLYLSNTPTNAHTRSVRKVSDRIFLCEHLMDYNLARLHEPTLNLSAHA